MRFTRTTVLSAPKEQVWELLLRPSTLTFVAKGYVSFRGVHTFPERWSEGVSVDLKPSLFGLLPAGEHIVNFIHIDHDSGVMETVEHGGIFESWDHTMRVEAVAPDRTHYTDTIDFDASALTRPAWLFVSSYYRHRQRRWPLLLQDDGGR